MKIRKLSFNSSNSIANAAGIQRILCTSIKFFSIGLIVINALVHAADYPDQGFAWENTALGFTDDVPVGFQSLVYEQGIIKIGPVELDLQSSLFPSSIKHSGIELLKTPIRLQMSARGIPLPQTSFESTLTHKSKTTATVVNTAQYAAVSIKSIIEVDVDGFMTISVSMTPTGTLKIDELQLVIEMNSAHATRYGKYLEYDFVSQKVVRSSILGASGQIKSEPKIFSFNPVIWVGDKSLGIELLTPTNSHHFLSNSSNSHTIRKTQNSTLWTNQIIDKVFALNSPLNFKFGLFTTGAKIQKSVSRSTLFTSRSSSTNTQDKFHRVHIGHWRGDQSRVPGVPVPDIDDYASLTAYNKLRKKLAKNKIAYAPYSALHLLPTSLAEMDVYRAKWSAENARDGSVAWKQKLQIENPIQPVSLDSQSIQDFVLHTHKTEQLRRPTDGMYFDVASMTSIKHSTQRYVRSQTALNNPSSVYYPIFEHRQFVKRYWVMMKEMNRDFLIIHHGSQFSRYTYPWIDAAVFGEYFHNFFESVPMTKRRTKISSRQNLQYATPSKYVPDYQSLDNNILSSLGDRHDDTAHVLLPQVVKFNETYLDKNPELFESWTESALAFWLLNDSRLWNTRLHHPTVRKVLTALSKFHEFNSANTSSGIGNEQRNVLWTRYAGENQSLLVLYNSSTMNAEVTLDNSMAGHTKKPYKLQNIFSRLYGTNKVSDNENTLQLAAKSLSLHLIEH